ncbi:Os01g0384450, partial [Oryza sativa Japonica Group]
SIEQLQLVSLHSDHYNPHPPQFTQIRRIRSMWSKTLRLSVFPRSSKERIPVMSYASCVVIALLRVARAMSDLLQLGSCPVGLP